MLLVKLITPKKINALGSNSARRRIFHFLFGILLVAAINPAFSQDNSPYTRYGLGDIVPSTNVNMRGMGSISAAYSDFLSINFNNPASYSNFQVFREAKSKKILYGRSVLDLGLNFENRTLRNPGQTGKFTASNGLFSHLQVGVPLKSNWGLSFGLRPITRISYNIIDKRRLYDENTGQPIDSAITQYQGDGGTYLASVGTGFRINISNKQSIAFGVNGGYLFGKKQYNSRRTIVNDSVEYISGNYQNTSTYGNLYFNMGVQFQTQLDSNLYLTIGAFGNLQQKLKASRDQVVETYYYDPNSGYQHVDSVYENKGIKGNVIYPGSFTAGFAIQKFPKNKSAGWLIGVDFNQTGWKDYRFYGQQDSVQNKWELRVGGELRPSLDAARKSYFGNVTYRAGFFLGPDYIKVKEKLPLFGLSFGLGLPLRNYNRLSPGQATIINLAFEFIKRGNNDNLLKENLFRMSVAFSLSDFWFAKKKYE